MEKYTNLRIVSESLLHLDAVISAKKTDVLVKGWKTVKQYSAATVIGYYSIQNQIKNQKHISAANIDSALKILKGDRVEILVLSRFDMIKDIQKTEF